MFFCNLWLVQVFCVHGGIPSPKEGNGLLGAINNIPVPLPDPETESLLAWEILWSDPLRQVFVKIKFC